MAIFLKNIKNKFIDTFVADVTSNTNIYYAFASKHTPWANELSPDVEDESNKSSDLDIKKEMIFGKRIGAPDVAKLIRRVNWTSGTVYAMYDHRDKTLFDKNFYVVNTTNAVFKCLNNNGGGVSTQEPTSITVEPFTLSDGYTWKYMYTISSVANDRFTSTQFVPIVANTTVEASAIDGAIDFIITDTPGTNYKTSSGTIQQVINSRTFRIENSNPNEAGYYTGSSFYITTGPGTSSISVISSYVSNSAGRFVLTTDPIPDATVASNFLISPQVRISGDGAGAKAYSTVAENGGIDKIFMLSKGSGYTFSDISILANPIYGAGGTATAIISPKGGHGKNPDVELGCSHLGITVRWDGDESSTIPVVTEFRQVGIAVNPTYFGNNSVYSNTTFDSTMTFGVISSAGVFAKNEIIQGLTSNKKAVVAFSNTSTVIATSFEGDFTVGETILGEQSAATAIISNINNPDIDKSTADIFYYNNVNKVQRSSESVETVNLIIKF